MMAAEKILHERIAVLDERVRVLNEYVERLLVVCKNYEELVAKLAKDQK